MNKILHLLFEWVILVALEDESHMNVYLCVDSTVHITSSIIYSILFYIHIFSLNGDVIFLIVVGVKSALADNN